MMSMRAAIGIAVVAAAAAFGDFIWYSVGVRHTMTAGLLHGALLLTTVGGTLGAASGRLLKGLPLGTLAGIGGALSYYLLVVLMDSRTYGTAIPGAWIMMWALLAALEGRWLRAPNQRSWSEVATRGAIAAIAGGIAFVLVRNRLWGQPAGIDRNYLLQFATWAFAWAPGLLALTWGTNPRDTVAAIDPHSLWSRLEQGERLHILDVRTPQEFIAGHVPGATNIPFNQLGARLTEVPGAAHEELFVYCGHGPRAHMALSALRRGNRTSIVFVTGHFAAWQRAGLGVER